MLTLVLDQMLLQKENTTHVVNCLKRLDEINYLDISLASEDIKAAINEIEAITMKTTNDDILDIIFNEFCIGK